jgi:hypothetical protein
MKYLSYLFMQANKILDIYEYCQSEHFFQSHKNEIRSMFHLKPTVIQNPSMVSWENKIKSSRESVCVHIRRGDFVSSESRLVDMSFYTDAMAQVAQILKKRGNNYTTSPPEYFLFSDGISYVWDYFGDSPKFNTTIRSSTRSSIMLKQLPGEEVSLHWVSRTPGMTFINDFHLLTKCRHNIISGSSFGWWGAYLGDQNDKIVIAAHYNPDLFEWWNYKKVFQYKNFYYPIGWIVKDTKYVN